MEKINEDIIIDIDGLANISLETLDNKINNI